MNTNNMNAVPMREKFFGCIAAVHIGSSMGAQVESWKWRRIQSAYGIVDRLWSYEHYKNGWTREPGTTEDGVERQKLMITAIIDKQDRVTAEDVRKIWCRDIKAISIGKTSEPFEAVLLNQVNFRFIKPCEACFYVPEPVPGGNISTCRQLQRG